MRYSITIFLSLISMISFSQIKVNDINKGENIGNLKVMGVTYIQLKKYDDEVVFIYNDDRYKQISSFQSFSFNDSDMDAIYDLFNGPEGIIDGTKKQVELDSGDRLFFTYKKYGRSFYAEVSHYDELGLVGKIKSMTPKQLKKLFGK